MYAGDGGAAATGWQPCNALLHINRYDPSFAWGRLLRVDDMKGKKINLTISLTVKNPNVVTHWQFLRKNVTLEPKAAPNSTQRFPYAFAVTSLSKNGNYGHTHGTGDKTALLTEWHHGRAATERHVAIPFVTGQADSNVANGWNTYLDLTSADNNCIRWRLPHHGHMSFWVVGPDEQKLALQPKCIQVKPPPGPGPGSLTDAAIAAAAVAALALVGSFFLPGAYKRYAGALRALAVLSGAGAAVLAIPSVLPKPDNI